jgi:parallel beta-helix repeat protein
MATFTVTNLNDSGAGSLRQAIIDANTLAGADTIQFQSTLAGTITLTSGELAITDSLTINGLGSSNLTVSGNNSSRIFNIDDGSGATFIDVTLSGMTLTGGNAVDGGAIFDDGEKLTITDAVITGNTASANGGGVFTSYYDGLLTIQNTIISGNTAAAGGGIFSDDGDFNIQSSKISGNTATTGNGGGIFIDDTEGDFLDPSVIENSIITGNSAGSDGGGIYFDDTDTPIEIRNSTISGNTAGDDGAGAYIRGADYSITFENSEISGNTATGVGGGIYLYGSSTASVILQQSVVANNTDGGGSNDLVRINGTINATDSLIEAPEGAINGTNTNNTTGVNPNTVTLAVAPASTTEDGVAIVYTFTRTGPTTSALTVNFEVGGAATFGNDYTQSGAASFSATTGTVTFAVGSNTATVTLTPILDAVAESPEAITLTLVNGLYVKGTTDAVESSISDAVPITTGVAPADINFAGGRQGETINGTPGRDTLNGTGRNDILRGRGNADLLRGKGGKDRMFGGAGNDRMLGQGGNDRMLGQGGNDRMLGQGGRDELNGGAGSDRLIGGAGGDILIGGAGNDTLTGGGGRDLYVFNSVNNATDTIIGFNVAQDLIDLRPILDSVSITTAGKFVQFIQFTQVGANTELRVDTDGLGTAASFETLAVLRNINASTVQTTNVVIA